MSKQGAGEQTRYPEFRKLLKLAIGRDRKKTDFADAADLASSQLSRLLNQEEIPRPSPSTLKKISDASQGRVALINLYRACEYTDEEIAKADSFLKGKEERGAVRAAESNTTEKDPLEEEIRTAVMDLKKGIQAFCGKATRYESLDDILETIDMLYGSKTVRFRFRYDDGLRDFNGRGRFGAERYVNVLAGGGNDKYSVEFGFVLYVCKTEKNGIILSDAAFDLLALFEANHPLGGRKLHELSTVENARMSDYQTVFFIGDSYEKKVLKAALGKAYSDDLLSENGHGKPAEGTTV